MNDTEQRKAAKAFAEAWQGKGDEKQHTQQFWSYLLHRVYGITDESGITACCQAGYMRISNIRKKNNSLFASE